MIPSDLPHNKWHQHGWWGIMLFAFAAGMLIAFLRLDQMYAITFTVIIGLAGVPFESRRGKPSPNCESGEWQRKIDAEYLLEINGIRISLYRHGVLVTQFLWDRIIEIQHLSSEEEFPSLFWKVITESGEYQLPDGGRYICEFENTCIYQLPDYHEQSVVSIEAPAGFRLARSMWRKDDTHPKRSLASKRIFPSMRV
jgi:hypothetical protein